MLDQSGPSRGFEKGKPGGSLLCLLPDHGQAVNVGLLKAEEERGNGVLEVRRRPSREWQTLAVRERKPGESETELTCPQAPLSVFLSCFLLFTIPETEPGRLETLVQG